MGHGTHPAGLAFYERNDQYCFLTPRSIAALRYVETYEVEQ